MLKTDPLEQLKDIHLPEPISWWPLAPGWYLLFFFTALLISLIAYKIYINYRNALAKKQALRVLEHYQQGYNQEHNLPLTSAHISELLRRVALVYFPREQVASLHGDAWLEFLNQTANDVDFNSVRDLLLNAPFTPNPCPVASSQEPVENTLDLTPLFIKAKLWIKQRSIPCSN
jgi:hypothetical protein